MKTDIIIYVWNEAIGHEVEEHFVIAGLDEDGKGRATIGAWITKMISGTPVDDQKSGLEPQEG